MDRRPKGGGDCDDIHPEGAGGLRTLLMIKNGTKRVMKK